MAALTKGFSRVPDSARIVHAFHAWCAGARARVWFEYVVSDANPSDTPSRELELAGELFYPAPGVCSTPVPLLCPQLAPLSDPAGWVGRARARVGLRML